jgi:hypothetical protein
LLNKTSPRLVKSDVALSCGLFGVSSLRGEHIGEACVDLAESRTGESLGLVELGYIGKVAVLIGRNRKMFREIPA